MLSRKLSFALLALSLFVAEHARAEITVTEEQTAYFGGVTYDLQMQLAESATNLNTAAGVKEYRDRAQILRLLADVLGFNRPDWNVQSLFAQYLYKTNYWVNRNLKLANSEGEDGENLFPAMFEILDTYTDKQISESGQLRRPLVKASKSIEDTSFLETMGAGPPAARLSDKELDLAVLFAAMGVASYPEKISLRGLNDVSDLTAALKFFKDFLTQPTAMKRLRALATSNSVAAIAHGVLGGDKFSGYVDTLATFGNAGVDARTLLQSTTQNVLDAVVDHVRDVKSDYQSQSTPVSPSRDLSRDVPFIQPGPPYPAEQPARHGSSPYRDPAARANGFNPHSSVDLATLSSKLMYEMSIQAGNFANQLDENQEIAQLREFHALRTIAENLDWITAGWKAGEDKNKPFVQLLYDVNPWVMRNLMALRRGEESGENKSQLQRLKKALKKYDVGVIRAASVAVQERQYEETVSLVPQEASMDKNDILGVVTIALAYLRVAPEILIHEQHRKPWEPRASISEIAENIRKCLMVVARFKQYVLQTVDVFQNRPSISNLDWNVWYDSKFPIAALAERGDDLVGELDLVRMQVLEEKNWAPQLIRICLGAGVRKGEPQDCNHWDLLDGHFGIRPKFTLQDLARRRPS